MTVYSQVMLGAGIGSEATIIGGLCLLALATALAWLSTHVPENEGRTMGTITSWDASVPLVTLGSFRYNRHDVSNSDDSNRQAESPEDTHVDKPEPTQSAGSSVEQLLNTHGLHEQTVASPLPAHSPSSMPSADIARERMEDRATSSSTHQDITVRLKFFDDSEELAKLSPQDTIGNLKSKYFGEKEHHTKLIFQGQLLRDPRQSLLSLNITHNSVVHCHISQAPSPSEAPGSEVEPRPIIRSSGSRGDTRVGSTLAAVSDRGLNRDSMVVPAFAVILGVMWFFRVHYSHLFTTPATIFLVGVSLLFVLMVYISEQ